MRAQKPLKSGFCGKILHGCSSVVNILCGFNPQWKVVLEKICSQFAAGQLSLCCLFFKLRFQLVAKFVKSSAADSEHTPHPFSHT